MIYGKKLAKDCLSIGYIQLWDQSKINFKKDEFSTNYSFFVNRLDFDNLVLTSASGAVTTNYLTVDGPTGQDPPVISGTNTGWHSKFFNDFAN